MQDHEASYDDRLESFLDRVTAKFGDKFDLSHLNFVSNLSKVTIGCPEHGFFDIRPKGFIDSKFGCSKCYKNVRHESRTPRILTLRSGRIIKTGGSSAQIDLTDETFGMFLVIGRAGLVGVQRGWKKRCTNCGDEKISTTNSLLHAQRKGVCCRCNGIPRGEIGFTKLLESYKRICRHRKRSFALSDEEFRRLTSGNCHYCGVSPSRLIGKQTRTNNTWGDYHYNGIDRVDSRIGYVTENCVSCCRTCNIAKLDMSYGDFKKHIRKIALHMNLLDIPVELHLLDAVG